MASAITSTPAAIGTDSVPVSRYRTLAGLRKQHGGEEQLRDAA